MGANSSVTVTGEKAGGIVAGYEAFLAKGGPGYAMVVEDCVNYANVTGGSKIGGVVGDLPYNGRAVPGLARCANYGTVSASSIAGGIAGQAGQNDITDCYNKGEIKYGSRDTHGGGIAGQGPSKVSNCYSAGKQAGGCTIAGTWGFAETFSLTNCYYDSSLVTTPGTVQGKALTSDQMRTWAFAYVLNGGKTGTSTTWTHDASKNDGYPVFGPLAAASDWAAVGAGVDAGIIAGQPEVKNDVYQISSPEQLAWFAYKVNTENAGYKSKKAKLTGDINLSGKDYGGTETSDFTKCLQWVPISPYSGDFDGGGFAVQNLYIDQGTDHVGFFGSLQGIASDAESDMVSVHDFGVASGLVTGVHTVGGIAGSMGRVQNRVDVTIKRCWNNASVKGTGKTGSETMAGGIAGYVNGSIVDCYNTGSVNAAAASAGGIAGSTTSFSGYTRVANCYNTGTVTGPSQYGAINGWHQNSSSPTTNCYYLKGSAPAGFGRDPNNGEAKELTADQLKSWAAAYALNNNAFGANTTWTADGTSYPTFGTLGAAPDWAAVGAGVDAGLITGTDFKPTQTGDSEADAYQISTPEALAWFAYKVNEGSPALKGAMASDVDLAGLAYGGTMGGPLGWTPIGTTSFAGSFDGGGHVVRNLSIPESDSLGHDYAGLFGAVKNGASISRVGVELGGAGVFGNERGGSLAGYTDGEVRISGCYAVVGAGSPGAKVASDSDSAAVGGLVGGLDNNSVVTNSYAAVPVENAAGVAVAFAFKDYATV